MTRILCEEGNLVVVDFGGSEVPLTKKQLAAQLQRSPRWIELQCREGMPSTLDGNRRMFRLSDVRAWLESQGKAVANG